MTAHDAGTALALLADHDRTFANGALLAEAELVRIDALLLAGRTAEAVARGHAFLDRFPHSPLDQRVRSLLANPPK